MTTAQQTIFLYKNGIPNSKPAEIKENQELGKDGILRISNVISPTLTVFKPAAAKANGTAVIICPGGGYGIVAFGHEGTDVAKVFNEWGVTVFVLKYRLPNDMIMDDKSIGSLQDAQRAIQMVREHAQEWNVNPKKIGIMGFSAGGHLVSTAGTHFNKAFIENPENTNLRPDFLMLIYPVISFTDSIGHIGSRNALLDNNPSMEKILDYSNELQVTKETPTSFLVHCSDDDAVKVQNSLSFYEALQKNKVLSELHIYAKGGHGFGMNNPTTKDKWMDRLKNWMDGNGWIKK
ncbi:alpha/beta hydrolase [Flavobacterium sp. ZB4P13]|uniref:alpha/beta hydrolase n=1 Tax=Flavobacterium sp. ZB4P13 TaxID=3401728 RepID=UPI003AAE9B95